MFQKVFTVIDGDYLRIYSNHLVETVLDQKQIRSGYNLQHLN